VGDSLLERFQRGDRNALSRLLSMASRGESSGPSLGQLPKAAQQSRVVAVTGSGGVGKSTLIGKLIPTIRKENQSVAILACDPRSPLTGGALLGDRFRMPASPEDDGVFIRSLAAASGQGSVAGNLPLMIHLLKAFGFDWVLIETVGAGQGDTGVRDLADVVVLLLQPETGDDLQWEKAGLLEVADIIVIHKTDLPGAERMEAQIRDILGLSAGKTAKVVRASSKSGKGIEELWQAIRTDAARAQGQKK
jgi:LAO/AO transport system ATPase